VDGETFSPEAAGLLPLGAGEAFVLWWSFEFWFPAVQELQALLDQNLNLGQALEVLGGLEFLAG
jgi:hypothetical protein